MGLIKRLGVKRKDKSVNLALLAPDMQPVLDAARRRGDVITSGAEGIPGDKVHLPTSLHYPAANYDKKGHAVDVQNPDTSVGQSEQIAYYDRELPLRFKILDEGDHLHISYDVDGKRV
jgi:hypothetical protein